MPPALSLTGPQLSMARQIGRLESIPRAARATPQKPRVSCEKQQTAQSTTTGMMVEQQPRERPYMMLVAGPILQASDSSCTGLQVQLVMIYVTQPMTSPPRRPRARQKKGWLQVLGIRESLIVMVKEGRKMQEVNQRTGRRRSVEQTSCFFSSRYTSFGCVISSPSVIIRDTTKLTRIPAAGTSSTQRMLDSSYAPRGLVIELHPMISAAHVDSAKDPNRSAPIPAISPTLSPTLSAIVAGFRGLSSGSPLSIFPTKSDPRSAALVKIPPPTRAKSATVEPPRPKPATDSKRQSKQWLSLEDSSRPSSSLQVQMRTSSVRREAATRAKPMTTPARQARRKALPRELRAQIVVLKLERVAICIPNAPQAMEVPAPTRKASVVQALLHPSTHAHTIPAMPRMKTPHVRYSETMNSVAPSWMMAPISTMPSEALKLILCISSSSEWESPMGTALIWQKLSQAHTAPTATANTINIIKNHIYYTKHPSAAPT